ncbi:TPA: hypothetical protein DCZ39_00305 [Patescibacteria group bacterium]|nr:hypothetical protein [Candidatus Gracilibacteria bacterium]
MTESDSISALKLMITDAYRAVFALRDISAVMTDDASGIAFLIDEDSDFLALREIFLEALARQLGKIRSDLLCHINEKNSFNNYSLFIIHYSLFYGVVKAFVIHYGRFQMINQKISDDEF